MQVTIGDFDASTNTIPARFEHKGVIHDRTVNACLDQAGAYDPEATSNRIKVELARGVLRKIETGVITNNPVE